MFNLFLGSYGDFLAHRSDGGYMLIWRHKTSDFCLEMAVPPLESL
ncbi:hypothetical protein SynSYN20_01055 [Synechococcus sp. SYN20]|nr:hypothetical protein SynSYN20_01055 [Synechococcus sp. SYN20]